MERQIRVYRFQTAVVGTGAAGFNAADRLWQYGVRDIALVTEGRNMGTSRNTGSDKQTYYKLTLAGGEADSVMEMARTLFEGECMDGDLALCEAALSAGSFLRLAELGVAFPRNRYGEFIGYRTDHDPRRRATSVGPYTSRQMTECLERSVTEHGIPILDRMQVIRILSDGDRAYGLLCLDLDHPEDPDRRLAAICCRNIIYCTGGPAGMYAESVYPAGHMGGSGAAFRAGARGRNLTEWQYGLASVHPRWNVSGTYMQVLPRFISTDVQGGDAREFLRDFFRDEGRMLTCVFMKGYQWPFDVRKVREGSSIIDILVYRETLKGRRVFLDFRDNPGGHEVDYAGLSPEAGEYLQKAGACFGTPLQRLRHMNAPALDFYREHGVDLASERLEIALCAQHNNGGLAVDLWWQTDVKGLYAAGEAAGTHGVYRPGGSALNAGQVGSARAAQHIACLGRGDPDEAAFGTALNAALEEVRRVTDAVIAAGSQPNVREAEERARRRMSDRGAAIRDPAGLEKALADAREDRARLTDRIRIPDGRLLGQVFRLEDMLISQEVYLSAMLDYARSGGGSRGSALYTDPAGEKAYDELPEIFRFRLDDGKGKGRLQEMQWTEQGVRAAWRPVHPIPQEDDFFENVWRDFRENGNVY